MKVPFLATLVLVLALMVIFPVGHAVDRMLIWIALAFFTGLAWILRKHGPASS